MEKAMTNICSNVDEARVIAKRLIRRNEDFARAEKNRDACLYKFFDSLHELDRQVRKMGGRQALKAKYGNIPTNKDSAMLAVKLTHLPPKACSKYAAVLRFIREEKKPGESIRKFVRANGDINGCVAKEKQLRDAKKSGGIGKGLKAHKVTKRKNGASMRSTV
jgi:hypothetical protein